MKMSKKLLTILLLTLTVFNVQTVAKEQKQYFKIYADSQNEQEAYKVKNQLIQEFQTLVEGLDETQYRKAIQTNLPISDTIEYDDDTIKIVLGDGKGVLLSGELKTDYCQGSDKKPLETKFFLLELFE